VVAKPLADSSSDAAARLEGIGPAFVPEEVLGPDALPRSSDAPYLLDTGDPQFHLVSLSGDGPTDTLTADGDLKLAGRPGTAGLAGKGAALASASSVPMDEARSGLSTLNLERTRLLSKWGAGRFSSCEIPLTSRNAAPGRFPTSTS